MGIARNILKTCHFPLPPVTSGCVSPTATFVVETKKNQRKKLSRDTVSLINRPWKMHFGVFWMDYSTGRFLTTMTGVPVDSQNRKRPVITNWIHSSIYHLKSSTVRFRRLTETSPTVPCPYSHVSFTFLSSIEKSSTDSRLWTWMNKLLIKIESLESTNNFFARQFLHCTKDPPPKKKERG